MQAFREDATDNLIAGLTANDSAAFPLEIDTIMQAALSASCFRSLETGIGQQNREPPLPQS